jgi:ABC-type antimicrobial peptide transport system, ATPase component
MLRLENISKYYINDNNIVVGLRKFTASLNTGEFVIVTGPSGSGKSTLLNILSGVDSSNEGDFFIDSEDSQTYDEKDWEKYRKEYVGLVYQDYKLIENFSVFQNVKSAYNLNRPDEIQIISESSPQKSYRVKIVGFTENR